MTKRVKLTEDQEDDIIRRATLAEKCQAWVQRNGVKAIAEEHGFSIGMVAVIGGGHCPEGRKDEEVQAIRRKYRAVKRVTALWQANSKATLRKEYHISTDKIDTLLGRKRSRKPNVARKFLTMRLTANPANDWCYYGRLVC